MSRPTTDRKAIDAALNAAVAVLQDYLGQNDGGVASVYFTGDTEADFARLMQAYLDHERHTEERPVELHDGDLVIVRPLSAEAIRFKCELAPPEDAGPAWFVMPDGARRNVRDGAARDWNGDVLAGWFTRRDVEALCNHFDLPFEEA